MAQSGKYDPDKQPDKWEELLAKEGLAPITSASSSPTENDDELEGIDNMQVWADDDSEDNLQENHYAPDEVRAYPEGEEASGEEFFGFSIITPLLDGSDQ